MANKIICDKLREARKEAKLSQKDVYEWLGVSQSTFSSWETGKSEPSLNVFLQLCVKYGIDNIADYFMSDGIYGKKRVLDNKMLNKLAELSERSRAAVYNCIDFEYSNMCMQQSKQRRKLPIYFQPAAAGLGNYLGESEYDEIEVNAPDEADAGIRISGDSMTPMIRDNDIVFIKFQPQILGDQVGIFVLNGEAFCKKLEYRSGEPYLCSFNPVYSPIRILPSDDLRVIGKVLL